MKLTLATPAEDMNNLPAACGRGNQYAQVSKTKLQNLLMDHAKLLQRVKPSDIETSVEDLL